MLSGIRNVTKGWVAGGLFGLFLLVLLVVFSVTGTGAGGIPNPFAASGSALASGKGVTITIPEFEKKLEDAIEQAREQTKRPISRQEAIEAGIAKELLDQLMSEGAIDAAAKRAGFTASNQMVANAIRAEPAFQSQFTGAFDKQAYASVLARNGLTPDAFESDLRKRMSRRQFATTAVLGIHAPSSIAKLLYIFETERRIISVAEISRERAGAPPEPTEAQVKAFYEENKAQLQTPEMRNLTVVRAAPQLFLAKVTVAEDAIKQAFEFKKKELASVERRTFFQISTGSRDAAAEAARQLATGADPRKIAAAVRGQLIPMTNAAKQDIPDAAVAETVFKLQKGQIAGPIQSSIAGVWAAAGVVSITPAGTVSYEQYRDQIGQQLAIEQAKTLMGDAVDKFEQERSGGKELEAAAQSAGLAVIKLERVLEQGVRDGGGPAPGLADVPDLLRASFLTSQGEATDFMPTPDEGYGLVRVDKVIAPGVRPYEQVKPLLVEGWKNREQSNAMQALVKQVQDQVGAGKPFAEVVKALNLRLVATEETVERRSIQQGGAPVLVSQVFAAKEKDVVAGPDANNRVLLVAQVDRIRREDPTRDAARFAAATGAVTQMLTNDTLNSLEVGSKSYAKVKPNAKLIASQLGIDAATGKPIQKDEQ